MKKILVSLFIFVLGLFVIGGLCYAEDEPAENGQEEVNEDDGEELQENGDEENGEVEENGEADEVVENNESQEKNEVVEIINGVVNALNQEDEKGFWELLKDYFSAETIAVIVSLVSLVIGLLKAVSVIKNLKVDKALTLEKVREELSKQLSNETKEQLNTAMVELTKPIAEQVANMTPTLETFSKVLALSQENTPTSRLAILELLSNVKQVDVEIVENAKEEVKAQVEEEEIKKEQTIAELEKIEKIEMPVE